MKPHKRPGRTAKKARQDRAKDRQENGRALLTAIFCDESADANDNMRAYNARR